MLLLLRGLRRSYKGAVVRADIWPGQAQLEGASQGTDRSQSMQVVSQSTPSTWSGLWAWSRRARSSSSSCCARCSSSMSCSRRLKDMPLAGVERGMASSAWGTGSALLLVEERGVSIYQRSCSNSKAPAKGRGWDADRVRGEIRTAPRCLRPCSVGTPACAAGAPTPHAFRAGGCRFAAVH